MSDEELLVLINNPKIKPSFLEGTVVSLTKDYTEMDICCSEYLKKGVYCTIIECGLSKYPCSNEIDQQTGFWSTATGTDGVEWCTVRIFPLKVDPGDEEDLEDVVKAEDLQPVSKEDLQPVSF